MKISDGRLSCYEIRSNRLGINQVYTRNVIHSLTCGMANNTATSHMMTISLTALESFDMLCAMNG